MAHAAIRQKKRERVVVHLESAIGARDIIGGDGVEFFRAQLALRFAREVMRLGREAAKNLPRGFAPRDGLQNFRRGFPGDARRAVLFF